VSGGPGRPGGVEIEVFWQIILGLYLGKKSKEVMFFCIFIDKGVYKSFKWVHEAQL
jgi:Na+/pantothenate symporter